MTCYNFGRYFKHVLFYFVIAAVTVYQVNAQSIRGDIGTPYIKNYNPGEYNAHGQNFAIVQDKRGLMYFGNFGGILEFDGTSWRTILTKNISKVSSLTINKRGKIFVGARGEIGYLQPNRRGQLQFVSLTQKIQKSQQNFSDVRFTQATDNLVYFVTDRYIFIWDGSKIISHKFNNSILNAFYINDRLYFLEKNCGLQYFQNYEPVKVPGGDIFSETVTISSMIDLGNGKDLIATGNQGLFFLDRNGINKFPTEADCYFTQNIISCVTRLSDGTFAIGTERGGAVILCPGGELKQIINKAKGLQDDNISYLYTDKNDNLWLALNNGLARITIPSYISIFNEKNGIDGGVTGILRNNNELYFSTYKGLFTLNYKSSVFEQVKGINTSCWSMLPLDNAIMAATSKGIYLVKNNIPQLIAPGFTFILYRSKIDPSEIYAGQTDGVCRLQNMNGQWTSKGLLPLSIEDVSEVAQDNDGCLWLGVATKGIIRYDPSAGKKAEYFDETRGLPSRLGNHLNETSAGIVVTTQSGIFQFNKQKQRFEKMKSFKADTSFVNEWLAKIVEDKNGNLWTNSGDEKNITERKQTPDNKYVLNRTALLPVADFAVWCIYPDNNGIVWLGGPEGAIRYDPGIKKDLRSAFPAVLRAVYCNSDSLVFGGTFFNADSVPELGQNSAFDFAFDYSDNTLRFEFSSPAYNMKEDIMFRFFLEGFDKDWSDWSKETQKEYTNLPAGNYIFHVRAKNIYGQLSSEDKFTFSIIKPFYQTWLARFIYLLLMVSTIIIAVRIRSVKLIKEKKKLENLITERTAEVVSQKEEIESQSLELSYKNHELEKINLIVKSINSEIQFTNLLNSILEKTKVIGGVEQATMLVRDRSSDKFIFKAGYGWDISLVESVQLNWEEAEERYLSCSDEIFEDIYSVREITTAENNEILHKLETPCSALIMLVKINDKPEGFLILENMRKKKAFDDRDFSLLKNLKEHIISAFIKTNILENLQTTLINLKETQEQLIRQEKLASIGQLTKGIVDRILNPLNYINNLSLITNDLALEIKEGLDKQKDRLDSETTGDMDDLLGMVEKNALKINEHGSSASRIVKGMEKLLRERSAEFVLTDINALVESHVEIAIQEIKKEYRDFKADIINQLDRKGEKVKVLPAEIGAVIVNLVNNACYSVYEKSKKNPAFHPAITFTTIFRDKDMAIKLKDNGGGIPPTEMKQLFAPFFTTKPTAKGTGLGLYMSMDIVKSHKGDIIVDSKEGEYTEFTILIPILERQEQKR